MNFDEKDIWSGIRTTKLTQTNKQQLQLHFYLFLNAKSQFELIKHRTNITNKTYKTIPKNLNKQRTKMKLLIVLRQSLTGST